MKATLAAASSWSIGGADAALPDLPVLAPGFHTAPDPPRPEAIPPAIWRRMGRAGRLVAGPATAALATVGDRDELALFWGTMTGEHGVSRAFVNSLALRGPTGASPLAFQHSVQNAPAGLLSMAFGLRGHTETLCAGANTGFALLERALVWVALRGRPALIVAADELGPEVRGGLAFAPHAPYGEGAAALLLLPDGEGPTITLEPGDGAWMRAWRWPDEAEITADPQRAHDARLGLYGCVDLVAMACLARIGGSLAWRGAATPQRVRID